MTWAVYRDNQYIGLCDNPKIYIESHHPCSLEAAIKYRGYKFINLKSVPKSLKLMEAIAIDLLGSCVLPLQDKDYAMRNCRGMAIRSITELTGGIL